MEQNSSNLVTLNLSKCDYMLLLDNNKNEYASYQGTKVEYKIRCNIMKCLKKLKSHSNKYALSAQEEAVLLD